jgi:lysophospholipase L1-like esterase
MTTTLCVLLSALIYAPPAQAPAAPAAKSVPAKAAPAKAPVPAATKAPDRWEKDIAAFEARDKSDPPQRDAVLFVGASSIRLWETTKAFSDLPTINRGFGGSQMGDSLRYAERIVIPHKPHLVVLMAGGNDIAAGRTPEQVRDDFAALVKKIHAALPKTKFYYLSLYPSVRRQAMDDRIRRVNELIGDVIKSESPKSAGADQWLVYVDVRQRLSTTDGGPRPDLLRNDGLHLNDKGYAVVNEIVGPILRKEMNEKSTR